MVVSYKGRRLSTVSLSGLSRASRTMPKRIAHFFNHLEWMKQPPAGNFVQIWPRLRTPGVWPTIRLYPFTLRKNMIPIASREPKMPMCSIV
jgi:hypothetical protein